MASENSQSKDKGVAKVFISYSWDSKEHKAKVLAFSNSLRLYGIDSQIDQYYQFPPEGWYRWMIQQIEKSNFVLVICTEAYKKRYLNEEEPDVGRGVSWEGGLMIDILYAKKRTNQKFIPVLFSPNDENHIPPGLQGYTVYKLYNDNFDPRVPSDFQNLYLYLTGQAPLSPPKLGQPLDLMHSISDAHSAVPAQSTCSQDFTEILSKGIFSTKSPSKKDRVSVKLIYELFDILNSYKLDVGINRFEKIAHKSLFSKGRLKSDFVKRNFSPAFDSSKRYPHPPEITDVQCSRRKELGYRSEKESGEELIYYVARKDVLGALPGEVCIFFPRHGQEAKISGLSL